jgi:pimeloyl-ACP methyl ester carboxylesterase
MKSRRASEGAVETGGRRLAYWSAGAGPPVLLLHGGWSDGREWWPQLDGLSDEFAVVAWDAPGCGGSSDPPESFGIADYADAAGALIDALGLGPVHVVGLSFGGALAIEVQRRHPGLVRSLVLASAYAGWSGSLPPDVVAERLARALAEAERPPSEWAAGYLPGFFASPVDQATRDEVLRIMHDCRTAGLRAMVRAFAAADLRDALPGIDVPTLVLSGGLDERAPLPVAEALHAAIPGAQLVVLPGAGHCTNLEAPEAFDREVRAFLRACGAGADRA